MSETKQAESGEKKKCGCGSSCGCGGGGSCVGKNILKSLIIIAILVGAFFAARYFLHS